jgi:DNA-binding response OmpR family regulator
MAKILLVEDDENISNFINDFLTAQNHEVEAVDNGADANDNLRAYYYDLIILDVGLPDTNGLQLCKDYRARGGNTPIIFLTGKSETADLEKGLDAGGDDYVTKPFEMRVLAARVKAILRRPPVVTSDVLTIGEFALDTRAKRVTKKGTEIMLSPREFALLEFFMRNPDQVFSPTAILDRVWPSESDATDETLRTCLKKLRKKVDDANGTSIIRNVIGSGYCLDSKR